MRDDKFWSIMGYILAAGAFVVCMGLGSCVDDAVAMRALSDQGFTDARIRERSNWLAWANGCDGSDAVAWQVDAKREGKPVRLTVCSGAIWKGATVRSAH